MGLRYGLAIALLVLLCAPLAAARDIALVAHKEVALKTLALADVVKICKGVTSHWPDGKLITFVTRDPASPEMKVVLQKIYGMSPSEVNALIASVNHARYDRPGIVVVKSDEALVKRVETTPGAIGLVDVYSITGGVTVLKIGGKLPLEPGYPLHGN